MSTPDKADAVQKGIAFSTAILFRLSGRFIPGICERVVRPCMADNCGCQGGAQWPLGGWSFWVWDQAAMGWSFPAAPYREGGQWYNGWTGGGCCGVCELPSLTLPSPIAEVVEVVINGEILDPSAYKVEAFERLVRVDGGSWPCSQNRARESGPYPGASDGSRDQTFQVKYRYGRGPGEDGELAAAAYACELAKLFCGAADCALPQRIKSISREGVDIDFLDPMTFIANGQTGFMLADLWINSVNPTGGVRRSVISSLDGRQRRQGRGRGFS